MLTRARLLLGLTLLTGACQGDNANPFSPAAATFPPADTDILLVRGAQSGSSGVREVYALGRSGDLTQVTSCGRQTPICEVTEVMPAPDPNRIAVTRRADLDRDGQIEPGEDDGVWVIDLARGVSGRTLQPQGVSGLDWAPFDSVFVFSAKGEGGIDDLFSSYANGQSQGNVTLTATVRERRPRFDPNGLYLAYERNEAGRPSEIWTYGSFTAPSQLTSNAPQSTVTLPGTHFLIGSDTDPAFSPDGLFVVFRRLTGLGEQDRGSWDVMTVGTDGTGLQVVASGDAYRGAPDWGPAGIIFVEIPVGSSMASLVAIDFAGNRRIRLTQDAGLALSSPRWRL